MSHCDPNSGTSSKASHSRIYFDIIDNKCFQQSGAFMKGIAACGPNSSNFFDTQTVKPLVI